MGSTINISAKAISEKARREAGNQTAVISERLLRAYRGDVAYVSGTAIAENFRERLWR
jgi:hypothetical protein